MQLFASADREPATYTKEFGLPRGMRGVLVSINYTAEGGATAELDAKLQYRDGAEGAWDDLPGASIVKMTGVGEIDLMVYPGVAAIANRQVSIACPKALRLLAVVGVDNLTFSASVDYLD
jgi:hypothetical protein